MRPTSRRLFDGSLSLLRHLLIDLFHLFQGLLGWRTCRFGCTDPGVVAWAIGTMRRVHHEQVDLTVCHRVPDNHLIHSLADGVSLVSPQGLGGNVVGFLSTPASCA
jgi:hypothetical protein